MSFGVFQFRRGTSTEWSSANPILLSGELGLETNTNQFKIGDGVTGWNSLPYGGIQGQPGEAGLGNPATNPPQPIATNSSLGTSTTKYALEDHTHAGVSSVSVNGGAAQTGAVSVDVPVVQHAVLTATQANNTTTEQPLTNHTFIIPPGKSATINGILIFTAAATTTGAYYGIKVTQGTGANGNAVGSWQAYVNISSAAAATGLSDGDVFNLAGGATTPAGAGVLGTATVAGNNSAWLSCIVKNNSTNANTTIQVMFRSEVANSAITAQIGTSATCIIG